MDTVVGNATILSHDPPTRIQIYQFVAPVMSQNEGQNLIVKLAGSPRKSALLAVTIRQTIDSATVITGTDNSGTPLQVYDGPSNTDAQLRFEHIMRDYRLKLDTATIMASQNHFPIFVPLVLDSQIVTQVMARDSDATPTAVLTVKYRILVIEY